MSSTPVVLCAEVDGLKTKYDTLKKWKTVEDSDNLSEVEHKH